MKIPKQTKTNKHAYNHYVPYECQMQVVKLHILIFLGHLNHSGYLLLWVGVRLRALFVNIFFNLKQEIATKEICNKFGK